MLPDRGGWPCSGRRAASEPCRCCCICYHAVLAPTTGQITSSPEYLTHLAARQQDLHQDIKQSPGFQRCVHALLGKWILTYQQLRDERDAAIECFTIRSLFVQQKHNSGTDKKYVRWPRQLISLQNGAYVIANFGKHRQLAQARKRIIKCNEMMCL